MVVENQTGANVTGLTGGALGLAPEGGSLFFDRTGPSPASYALLNEDFDATFQWTGRLNTGGTMGFSASASATGPDGQVADTGPVDCGVAVAESEQFDPSGFSGTCTITIGDAGGLKLEVRNDTGDDLTDIQPSFTTSTSTGSAQVLGLRGPGPRSARSLPAGQVRDFSWRASILGRGDVSIQLQATATRPNGTRISTGSVECMATLTSPGGNLPDLAVDEADLRSSAQRADAIVTRNFAPDDCAIVEGCVNAPGRRRLLRFNMTTPNLGPGDVFLGDPSHNPNMVFSQCHQHYHFEQYADYRLLDRQGNLVAEGHKQAFCLVDLWQLDPNQWPVANPHRNPQFTDCGFQGISSGWADIYSRDLPCQWIDITGVPSGVYTLSARVNPARAVEENDYSNNEGEAQVFIPPDDGR